MWIILQQKEEISEEIKTEKVMLPGLSHFQNLLVSSGFPLTLIAFFGPG